MPDPTVQIPRPLERDGFDYSAPEAQRAIEESLALVLEIRESATQPMARKIAVYEGTLGLAVIPVLLRRTLIVFARAWRQRRGADR